MSSAPTNALSNAQESTQHSTPAPVDATTPPSAKWYADMPLAGLFEPVRYEGAASHDQAFVTRAYEYRERARKIFDNEKQRFMASQHLTSAMKQMLQAYTLRFDGGTRRRGVCHYKTRVVGLSAAMIDRGVRPEKIKEVVMHELTHAVLPGKKHGPEWKKLNKRMGGDGKRCCTDEETSNLVSFKVVVACPALHIHSKTLPSANGHVLQRRQKAPAQRWLNSRVCRECENEKRASAKLMVYRF
jgi:predicted SprT family Zn-dependent metalloprotease